MVSALFSCICGFDHNIHPGIEAALYCRCHCGTSVGGIFLEILSEKEIDEVLKISRDYFENKGYKVYFTNARYEYNGGTQNVQPNELMIAFKE